MEVGRGWGGGISFSVCYYPRAGWSSILLFLVLLKEVRLRDHLFVSGVIKGTRKGGKTEIVSDVEIKVNQSTKPLNVGAINQNNKSIILLRQAHLLIASSHSTCRAVIAVRMVLRYFSRFGVPCFFYSEFFYSVR